MELENGTMRFYEVFKIRSLFKTFFSSGGSCLIKNNLQQIYTLLMPTGSFRAVAGFNLSYICAVFWLSLPLCERLVNLSLLLKIAIVINSWIFIMNPFFNKAASSHVWSVYRNVFTEGSESADDTRSWTWPLPSVTIQTRQKPELNEACAHFRAVICFCFNLVVY